MERFIDDSMEKDTMQYEIEWVGKAEETWEDEVEIEYEDLIQEEYLEAKDHLGDDGTKGIEDSVEVPTKINQNGEAVEENEFQFEAMETIIIETNIMQYKVEWVNKAEETWEDVEEINSKEMIHQCVEMNDPLDENGSKGEDDLEEIPAKTKKAGEGDKVNEDEFEVDSLVADRTTDEGKTQYRVHWRGYDSDQDTWENESNLGCTEYIEAYKANKAGGSGAPNNKGKKGRPSKKTKGAGAKGKAKSGGGKAKKAASGDREPDKVVGICTFKTGKRELLVRWKNLPDSEDSWEPEESLLNTPAHEQFLIREREHRAKREAELKETAPEE